MWGLRLGLEAALCKLKVHRFVPFPFLLCEKGVLMPSQKAEKRHGNDTRYPT